MDTFKGVVRLVLTTFTCSSLAKILHKNITQAHIAPATLHEISQTISFICSKGNTDLGTHVH